MHPSTLACLLLIAASSPSHALDPAPSQTPAERKAWASALGTVSITTTSQKNPTSVTKGQGTFSKNQIHQTGVWVHRGPISSKAVQGPYEIQCFFVGGGKSDVGSRIYDQQRQLSDLPYDAEFVSVPLAGRSLSIQSSNVDLVDPRTGRTYSGTVSTSTRSDGSKFNGWIVRVLVAGRLARVEASLPELRDFAQKNPGLLDSLAARATAKPPLADKKPASGFGNTSLDRR